VQGGLGLRRQSTKRVKRLGGGPREKENYEVLGSVDRVEPGWRVGLRALKPRRRLFKVQRKHYEKSFVPGPFKGR